MLSLGQPCFFCHSEERRSREGEFVKVLGLVLPYLINSARTA